MQGCADAQRASTRPGGFERGLFFRFAVFAVLGPIVSEIFAVAISGVLAVRILTTVCLSCSQVGGGFGPALGLLVVLLLIGRKAAASVSPAADRGFGTRAE